MMPFLRGTYIGKIKELKGESAILMPDQENVHHILAQFDNLDKFSRTENDYAFGWHKFSTTDFTITLNKEY